MRRRTLRMPLVAVTAALASALVTSVVIRDTSVEPVAAKSPGVLVVYAGEEDDSAVLRKLRDLSHTRRLESDASNLSTRQPGIFTG